LSSYTEPAAPTSGGDLLCAAVSTTRTSSDDDEFGGGWEIVTPRPITIPPTDIIPLADDVGNDIGGASPTPIALIESSESDTDSSLLSESSPCVSDQEEDDSDDDYG